MAEIRVPQEDGEIVITTSDGPTTYKVGNHVVRVKAPDVERFLRAVDGSEPPTKAKDPEDTEKDSEEAE